MNKEKAARATDEGHDKEGRSVHKSCVFPVAKKDPAYCSMVLMTVLLSLSVRLPTTLGMVRGHCDGKAMLPRRHSTIVVCIAGQFLSNQRTSWTGLHEVCTMRIQHTAKEARRVQVAQGCIVGPIPGRVRQGREMWGGKHMQQCN